MSHSELVERRISPGFNGVEVTMWVFHLNLQTHDEFKDFIDWAYDQYGMERQYDHLFQINVSYDSVGPEPAVQYHITTRLDDNQAMRWKLRWG